MTSSSHHTPPPPTNRARSPRTTRTSAPPRSLLQRNRTRLLWGLAAAALVAVTSMAYLGATSPAYACSTEWTPAPTQSPAPDATPRIGYVQGDLGVSHEAIGAFVRYAVCPPASGKHYNAQGEGPVKQGVYGPDDEATPQGWLHNLEHGGIVVLYRCREGDSACGEAAQAEFSDFYKTFPNSPQCGLPPSATTVVARFDEMAWPYAALVWGQVLPMDAWDPQLARDFYAQQGERASPEVPCARPTPTPPPAPESTPSPTPSPSPTPASTAAPTPSPTSEPTAQPAAS